MERAFELIPSPQKSSDFSHESVLVLILLPIIIIVKVWRRNLINGYRRESFCFIVGPFNINFANTKDNGFIEKFV